jgi:hypothetical protein
MEKCAGADVPGRRNAMGCVGWETALGNTASKINQNLEGILVDKGEITRDMAAGAF